MFKKLFELIFKKKPAAANVNDEIYIGNLHYKTDKRELDSLFSKYGKIMYIKIIRDHQSGRSKGYAFIRFSDQSQATAALAMDGFALHGRKMCVAYAKLNASSNA